MKIFGIVPIAKEGLPFIVLGFLLTFLFYLGTGFNGITISLLLISLFVLAFFRDPERTVPYDNDLIIAPADGVVVDISEIDEKRFLNKKVKKVSIFMSIFNVHVNRMPVSGKVLEQHYNPGLFFHAASEKASIENEQNAILIEREDNKRFLVVQIAGLIARRIVSYVKLDSSYGQGQRLGMIRFGSRVDLYFPVEAEVLVKNKQKTCAGETIIAKLPLKS